MANLLMEVLSLGKEAVYRRLRGEVPFTLAEAAILSREIGVSLDELTDTRGSNYVLFSLNIAESNDPAEGFYKFVENYNTLCERLAAEPDSGLVSATNMIPQPYYLKYPVLSKFFIFKWLYHYESLSAAHFSDFNLSVPLLEKSEQLVAASQSINNTVYIWDHMIFHYLVNDIRYFFRLQLISQADLEELRHDLMAIIDELEHVAATGRFLTGKEVQIYISDINFEATYSYLFSSKEIVSMIRIYTVNAIASKDKDMFEEVRNWIQSLKKFSTLISQSGEMQRVLFFNRQRDLVNGLE